jgi:hypothetical protein
VAQRFMAGKIEDRASQRHYLDRSACRYWGVLWHRIINQNSRYDLKTHVFIQAQALRSGLQHHAFGVRRAQSRIDRVARDGFGISALTVVG